MTLQAESADLIAMYDVRFPDGRVSGKDLELLAKRSAEYPKESHLHKFYEESFDWLFYGTSLPRCKRFFLPPPSATPLAQAASLLIRADLGVGVYSVWQRTTNPCQDLLELKHEVWNSSGDIEDRMGLGLNIEPGDRVYPFLGLRIDTTNIKEFCTDNAEEIGRLFTGGEEYEEATRLQSYVQRNLSHRAYERLFVRWTDGLAVYSTDIGKNNDERQKILNGTLFRAAQIFETCALVHQVLHAFSEKADKLSASLALYRPRPFAVNALMSSFLEVERDFISAPPVASIEARELLETAYDNFGIPKAIDSTRKSVSLLEQRHQWGKTQFLGAIAVLTYLADVAVKIFNR